MRNQSKLWQQKELVMFGRRGRGRERGERGERGEREGREGERESWGREIIINYIIINFILRLWNIGQTREKRGRRWLTRAGVLWRQHL